ncbi:MAG: ATP-binding protein [bacterium]
MKTIKTKILFGVVFLFSVILLLSILGVLFINQLTSKTKGTREDNYSSVDYMKNMFISIDEMNFFQSADILNNNPIDSINYLNYLDAKRKFEKYLNLETNTITEIGEAEIVNSLHTNYREYLNLYKSLKYTSSIKSQELLEFNKYYFEVRSRIEDIFNINMNAINKKNEAMQNTANDVTFYMIVVALFSIIVSSVFIFSFPNKIVRPIKDLTKSIKYISEKNYNQKLEIKTNDELGELAFAFNAMVEKLKLYDAKHIDRLLFEQKRMEAVVQSFEDGILFIDEDRKIVLVNNTTLQITGLKEEDLILHYIYDIITQNDLLNEIYKTVINHQQNFETNIRPLRVIQNNKEYFYNIESEEIVTYSELAKKEIFIGSLVILKNITKFQERDVAKTNLLATVSHELKTPLSSINLSIKLLEDKRVGGLNEKQNELLVTLKQQSLRLSRVINEILEFSQLDTGNIKLKFAYAKPDLVIDIAITALSMQLSEKNIDLETEIEEQLPEIYIDLEKLVFVLINILNNAIRFSKRDDRIIIKLQKTTDPLNEIAVEFSVTDNGPGIPIENQPKLFHKFSQVGNKTKHGWGLGLAISKEFVQAQNGKIWVNSQVGIGSTFAFSIPVKKT